MISLLFASNSALLLTILTSGTMLFLLGVYFILKQAKSSAPAILDVPPSDIDAIAGDDVVATQLDLARAYIDANKKQLAATILHLVVEQGNAMQRNQARALLGLMF